MLSSQRPEWKALEAEADTVATLHLRDLTAEPGRFDAFSLKLPGLMLDFSRQRVTIDTHKKLLALAHACELKSWRDRMFSGDKINTSEKRAVLHTALRRPKTDSVLVDGEDVMPGIHAVLERMKNFTAAIHSGNWTGHTGKRINTIVNIGIGGSDLGPRMAVEALKPFHVKGIDVRFVSNVDGTDINNVLKDANPETTLFLVASKTFTTLETMTNAQTARKWLTDGMQDLSCVHRHFVALSTNLAAVKEFGINPDNMFPFGEWVGGRYSLWSAIGLSISLAVGFDHFRALLDGGHAMDRHFQTAPLEKNAPVILGLLGVWNRNFLHTTTHAMLPYDQSLLRFPAFLQQGDMESNGKSVTRDGDWVDYKTGPVLFGEPGTNGQHSFYQLIHQGTDIIPCDFIAALEPLNPYPDHHRLLLANVIAQAESLAKGRSLAESGNDPAHTFPGNRPSTVTLLDRLDPFHLGQLIALHEHRIFVEGILWNINSFDQWGVELGKILASQVLKAFDAPDDSSQAGLLKAIKTTLRANNP